MEAKGMTIKINQYVRQPEPGEKYLPGGPWSSRNKPK